MIEKKRLTSNRRTRRLRGTSFAGGSSANDPATFRFYWEAILRYRLLVLVILGIVAMLVAVESFTATPLYRANVRVAVDIDSANVLPYEQVFKTSANDPRALESDIRTYYSMLQTRGMARGVIDRLELMKNPSPLPVAKDGFFSRQLSYGIRTVRGVINSLAGDSSEYQEMAAQNPADKLIGQMLDGIRITPVLETRLIDISFVSPSPRLAAKIAKAWAEEFVEQNFESRLKTTELATNFLQEELRNLKVKVEQSERDLNSYAQSKGILTMDGGGGNEVAQKLGELNSEITKAEATLIQQRAQYDAVKKVDVSRFPQTLRSPLIENLESRLAALRQNQARLSSEFGSEWPELRQVEREMNQVESQLRSEKEQAVREAGLQYQATLKQLEDLSALVNRQRQLAHRINADLVQYNTMKREADTNRQLYDGLLERLKQAGVEAGFRFSNIRVVDVGSIPCEVFWPSRTLNLAFAIVVGLFLGCTLAVALRLIDNKVHTPDDLSALDLPSLGAVPEARELSHGRRGLLASFPGKSLPDPRSEESQALVRSATLDSPVWEAYRRLRTNLFLSHADQPPRLILVTSGAPGEGKSTTVAHTGVVLAETGSPTLLIDLDLRKGGLSKFFGVKSDAGMSVYLSGHGELAPLIRPTEVPNLSIIPSGVRPPNPAALLNSKRLQVALQALSQAFQFILLDTGPLLSYTDALVLSKLVDGVVIVANSNRTPTKSLQLVHSQLANVGANVFGVLVNGMDVKEPSYGPYYGSYYVVEERATWLSFLRNWRRSKSA